jgi:hypothetical protein
MNLHSAIFHYFYCIKKFIYYVLFPVLTSSSDMGKKNLIFPINPYITSPLFPIYTTQCLKNMKEKRWEKKMFLYPANVRTTKPLTNTSESVAR